jgi:hypothetical protein
MLEQVADPDSVGLRLWHKAIPQTACNQKSAGCEVRK